MRKWQRDAASSKQHQAAPLAPSANGTAHEQEPKKSIARKQKPSAPPVIDPLGVYYREHLAVFGLNGRSIRRERKLGRLRVGRRCKRLYSLGKWLIEWLEAGEDLKHQTENQEVLANGQAAYEN